jgi:hypothetical protein
MREPSRFDVFAGSGGRGIRTHEDGDTALAVFKTEGRRPSPSGLVRPGSVPAGQGRNDSPVHPVSFARSAAIRVRRVSDQRSAEPVAGGLRNHRGSDQNCAAGKEHESERGIAEHGRGEDLRRFDVRPGEDRTDSDDDGQSPAELPTAPDAESPEEGADQQDPAYERRWVLAFLVRVHGQQSGESRRGDEKHNRGDDGRRHAANRWGRHACNDLTLGQLGHGLAESPIDGLPLDLGGGRHHGDRDVESVGLGQQRREAGVLVRSTLRVADEFLE